ncbi:hypothetical protein [Kocuria sabuli]|uniref:hypothetical protein n=1 Tax=Kocuria sabuli TaxID=3071448 RepID=UPI0034D5273A
MGHEQTRRLRSTMVAAGIDCGRLWLYCFSIGGEVSELEVDAYLHHSPVLSRLQRDLPARAADEILADLAPPRTPWPPRSARARPSAPGSPIWGAGTDRAPPTTSPSTPRGPAP